MRENRHVLLRLGFVLGVCFLITAGLVAAGQPDEGPALEAQARDALGLKDGDCIATLDALQARPDVSALTAQADSLGKPGRVGAVYFGTSAGLAADVKGTVVASGTNEVWVLSSDAGAKVVARYIKVDLKGRDAVAWVPATRITTIASCEPS